MKIYLASDLGFTETGRISLDALVSVLEKSGVRVINPWTLTDPSLVEKAREISDLATRISELQKANRVIAENNEKGIMESDCLVALIDGAGVDDGVAAEIGYACALGKKVFALRTDFRLASDNEGSTVNLQVEYFIHRNGGRIVRSVEALITVISS